MPPFGTVFSSVWIVVFAVSAVPGENVSPIAMVAKDAASGCLVEVGVPKLLSIRKPPYPTGPRALLVTIDAHQLAACHLTLGWRMPERVLDLLVEHRNTTNGMTSAIGGLSGALTAHGLSAHAGLNYGTSPRQMRQRLSAQVQLLVRMAPSIDLGRALLRGRYMVAVARIETTGIPIDVRRVAQLVENWSIIKARIVQIVDERYGVYRSGLFSEAALKTWLEQQGIAWPILPSGHLDLGDDTFRDMARAHPMMRPLKEIRATLADFDPLSLAIGRDGRNRTPLRPFSSRTGRNQPSAKASVFGSAAWVRHLVMPGPGTGLAMVDWCQQEFGIAAALSADASMQAAYGSGDPYLALAIKAGAASPLATPPTHSDVRTQYKTCALGMQYGMGTATLAHLTGTTLAEARDLQHAHKAAFPAFWHWSDAIETHAYLTGYLTSVFGWRFSIGSSANPRMLRNFPLQANGAEMLRLACCLATEDGIRVCMPLHDALLIEAPLEEIDDAVRRTQEHMAEASRIVLDGFALRTSVKRARAPDRWREPRGAAIWQAAGEALGENVATTAFRPPAHLRDATCSRMNSRPISLSISNKDGVDASD